MPRYFCCCRGGSSLSPVSDLALLGAGPSFYRGECPHIAHIDCLSLEKGRVADAIAITERCSIIITDATAVEGGIAVVSARYRAPSATTTIVVVVDFYCWEIVDVIAANVAAAAAGVIGFKLMGEPLLFADVAVHTSGWLLLVAVKLVGELVVVLVVIEDVDRVASCCRRSSCPLGYGQYCIDQHTDDPS